MKVASFAVGEWIEGKKNQKKLLNPIDGSEICEVSSDGVPFKEMLTFARSQGGSSLRKLTFHERGRLLKKLALYLFERKDKYYKISYLTGATKRDSWIDIEGGIGNLFAMSSKARREMPNDIIYTDGKPEMLSKNGTFIGHHVFTSKKGVAVHINAFNFPIWGMLEKIAVNLVSGVPAIVKPASQTSYLTYALFEDIIASNILPMGSLQLICGGTGDLLDHLHSQDVVTFTGSASTGQVLKNHPLILSESIPFNMEADSLNMSLLCLDCTPQTEEFNLYVKEVAREMTIKAGQKCTAIRRCLVPEQYIEDFQKALAAQLEKTTIGDPHDESVRMGPLASKDQQKEVLEKISELRKSCELLYGQENFSITSGDKDKGAFVSPHVLLSKNPLKDTSAHSLEAFGPVTTILPYKNHDEAYELSRMGEGSLVGSVFTNNDQTAREAVSEVGSHHGRIIILNSRCAKESTGHGSPLAQLVHGGPGRAGGGEEMGGLRGVFHYMQRTAIQGHPTTLSEVTGTYQPGGDRPESKTHPFKLHFEELSIGQTLSTHRRTITEADVVNFANVSWDHFYAHTDETSLENTLFEKRVAHGYFIISAAAGLFVSPEKGPVLANYGLDELRFTKPVYVGATMKVQLTVKEKIDQEDREGEIPRGVVKWQVEVTDETDEVVALGTILTLVKKLP